MRIAAIMATESVSGPGRQLSALAQSLRGRGVHLRALLLHRRGHAYPAFARYLERAGVEHEIVPDRGPLDVSMIARVRGALEDWDPVVVQTHGYKATALGFALRRLRPGWPWIGFFHGETREDRKAEVYHWIDRRMLTAADRIVVMSERQAAKFARCAGRVRVIHNAVVPLPEEAGGEAERWAAEALREVARPVLGVVGRLSHEKGVDVFLHACARLAHRNRSFSALIAGDGPERASLEALCAGLGLGDRVRFLGSVTAMRRLYRGLDLLVIPSRSEGLPNALLEALAADLPVVATDVGAIAEVLRDPRAGAVVAPESPPAMAAAIERMLGEGGSAGAQAARRQIAADFSLERRADAHTRLYAELAERAAVA